MSQIKQHTININSLNVFDQSSRMVQPKETTDSTQLIFNEMINGNIPDYHRDANPIDEIVLILVVPFENWGILGSRENGKLFPISEKTVPGFNFHQHGRSLMKLLKDDVNFVAGFLARLFVRLSDNKVLFKSIYEELKTQVNVESETSNEGRLVLDSTLAQRDSTVYYFTRCSMKLYNWLLVINDNDSKQKCGIDATVASKLMWMDRSIMFRDLRMSERDHYLWLNSTFKWFSSCDVSRFRGVYPEVEQLNELSYKIHTNSMEANSTGTIQEQLMSGIAYNRYVHNCVLIVSIVHQLSQTNAEWCKDIADKLRFHKTNLSIMQKTIDRFRNRLLSEDVNIRIDYETYQMALDKLHDNYRESINFSIAFNACKLMIGFYNTKIAQLGYQKINNIFTESV
jgi:hypothetical protein